MMGGIGGCEGGKMISCSLRLLYTLTDGEKKKQKRCGCGLRQSHKMALMHALCCHAMVQIVLRCVGRRSKVGRGRTRITAQIVITTIVVSSSQAWSISIVNHILFVSSSSPNPSLASESALCPPNPSPSSITTWTQRLANSSVALSLPLYRSLRPSVATTTLVVADFFSFRCWTSGTEDT